MSRLLATICEKLGTRDSEFYKFAYENIEAGNYPDHFAAHMRSVLLNHPDAIFAHNMLIQLSHWSAIKKKLVWVRPPHQGRIQQRMQQQIPVANIYVGGYTSEFGQTVAKMPEANIPVLDGPMPVRIPTDAARVGVAGAGFLDMEGRSTYEVVSPNGTQIWTIPEDYYEEGRAPRYRPALIGPDDPTTPIVRPGGNLKSFDEEVLKMKMLKHKEGQKSSSTTDGCDEEDCVRRMHDMANPQHPFLDEIALWQTGEGLVPGFEAPDTEDGEI